MSTVRKLGAELVADMRSTSSAALFVLTRGLISTEIEATISIEPAETENNLSSSATREAGAKFICKVEDYKINDMQTEPQIGDTLTSETGLIYKVLPDAGRSCWRYHDSHGISYSIYTKQTT